MSGSEIVIECDGPRCRVNSLRQSFDRCGDSKNWRHHIDARQCGIGVGKIRIGSDCAAESRDRLLKARVGSEIPGLPTLEKVLIRRGIDARGAREQLLNLL